MAASTKQTAIDAVTTVAELETYIKTNTGADGDYGVWPLDPDQVAASPTPEPTPEPTTPVVTGEQFHRE